MVTFHFGLTELLPHPRLETSKRSPKTDRGIGQSHQRAPYRGGKPAVTSSLVVFERRNIGACAINKGRLQLHGATE